MPNLTLLYQIIVFLCLLTSHSRLLQLLSVLQYIIPLIFIAPSVVHFLQRLKFEHIIALRDQLIP